MENRTSGFISIIIVLLIWGSAFSVTKVTVDNLPPFLVAFLRNLIASLILLPLYIWKRKTSKQAPPLPYTKILLLGLTGITFFYAFFNMALVYTSASAGALVQGLMPVAIALPAALFLKEKLSGRTIAGIILSVGGVILIGFIGNNTEAKNNILGSVLMILSVFSWAAYTIIAKSIHHHDPIVIPAVSTMAGTVFLLPLVVIELWGQPIPSITAKGWVAIFYLGIFSSAIGYILYTQALKKLSAAQVGNFLNLDPVIGATIAVIFLKDTMTAWQIAGAVLVLAGIWLSMEPRK
jgi:drug/metabolite transporter (DMT)-like permease